MLTIPNCLPSSSRVGFESSQTVCILQGRSSSAFWGFERASLYLGGKLLLGKNYLCNSGFFFFLVSSVFFRIVGMLYDSLKALSFIF